MSLQPSLDRESFTNPSSLSGLSGAGVRGDGCSFAECRCCGPKRCRVGLQVDFADGVSGTGFWSGVDAGGTIEAVPGVTEAVDTNRYRMTFMHMIGYRWDRDRSRFSVGFGADFSVGREPPYSGDVDGITHHYGREVWLAVAPALMAEWLSSRGALLYGVAVHARRYFGTVYDGDPEFVAGLNLLVGLAHEPTR